MKLATKIFRRNDWYVTSPYGWRNCPFHGKEHHNGTDYGTHVQNWPMYAIEDGYVQLVTKSSSGYGNRVWVRYPRINKSIMHAHMKDISVKKGDKVKEGTLLGHAGKTGNATGIHLHLGMTKIGSDKWENPHAYDYQAPAPSPQPTPSTTYKVGDKVKFTGTLYSDSAGNGPGQSKKNLEATIYLVKAGAKCPYNINKGLGWVKAESLSPIGGSSETIYIVQKGDTLSSIAAKYKTNYQHLAQVNNISNPNVIHPGQKIVIK